jgi:prephenate dehydrogenase
VTTPYRTAVIIGTGLLGASLGLALKQRQLAHTVIGTGRRQSSLDTARERGAIVRGSLEVEPVVRDADLVVICTPAASVPAMLDTVRNTAPKKTIITDVTSTKRAICEHAAKTWTAPRRFIGSHPMAGSENFGPEHADANLYESRQVLVETGPGLDENAREAVCNLWRSVGASITGIDPAEHDRVLARTSHVPHIAAAAVALLSASEANVGALSGGGFRDITRVAAGRPELWRDICLTNADAVKSAITELIETLELFGAAIDREDATALEQLLEEGRQARLNAVGDES